MRTSPPHCFNPKIYDPRIVSRCTWLMIYALVEMNVFIVPWARSTQSPPSLLRFPCNATTWSSKDTNISQIFSHFRSLWRGAPPWHLPPAHWSSPSPRTPQSFECPRKIQTLALSEASVPLTLPHPSRLSWRSWNENGNSFLFNDFSSSSSSWLALFQLFLTGVFSHLEHRSSSCPAFC